MTTTELIKFLQKYEFGGATGRPREVYICADGKIYDFDIKNFSAGDGLITELYIDLGKCKENELINALQTALRYNGLNERVKEWAELEPNKYKVITFTNQYDWKNMDEDESQLQLVWMMCVLLYGDYGTSPRFGWIEDVKGFKEFCEKLAEDEEIES